jgi:hypothetical protein
MLLMLNFEVVELMKYFEWTVLLLFLFSSCSEAEKFPEYVTLPLNNKDVNITTELNRLYPDSGSAPDKKTGDYSVLDSLMVFKEMYLQRNEAFHLERLQKMWIRARQQTENAYLNDDVAVQWFNITGFIFELTGNALFAEELEKISVLHLPNLQPAFRDSLVIPYIFTKNLDHIWVNLFLPAELNYTHSLGGEVNISMETDFPENGSIRLNISMETKRHIEIFVRIPSWADDASVTVKKVKYFARPGSYCLIAKKWKEGDVVEIEIPVKNLPSYLKTSG